MSTSILQDLLWSSSLIGSGDAGAVVFILFLLLPLLELLRAATGDRLMNGLPVPLPRTTGGRRSSLSWSFSLASSLIASPRLLVADGGTGLLAKPDSLPTCAATCEVVPE